MINMGIWPPSKLFILKRTGKRVMKRMPKEYKGENNRNLTDYKVVELEMD